jgi:uncharacterized protein (TIGR00159 family)
MIWPEFIHVRWLDLVDILLVSILLFQLYRLINGTVALRIFTGMLALYVLWLVVRAMNMQLLGSILGQFIGVGVIALIVVFQQELRKFLLLIGSSGILPKSIFGENIFSLSNDGRKEGNTDINAILKACKIMALSKTGAIIVFGRRSDLSFYVQTGEALNSKVSQLLIESIFYKNSPLHDGALIISDNKLLAARCILPVSENQNFPAQLGMRHRSGVGVTENTDAVSIIISEQTGEIAFAEEGELKRNISIEQLKSLLEKTLLKSK